MGSILNCGDQENCLMPYPIKGRLPVCKKAGVYAICNTKNGKVYVGSAVCIRGRMLQHRSSLRRGVHESKHLQNAWNRYGELAFIFRVLETCDPGDTIAREQVWIDRLKATDEQYGYNLCAVAGGGMKGLKHSLETRANWSRKRKGKVPVEATAAAAEATRGKPRPAEVCERIGAKQRGRVKTPEHLAKLKANHWSKRPDAAEIAERSASKNRGEKHTDEHKEAIRNGLLKHYAAQTDEPSN